MFCALSFFISASCWPMISPAWSQAKPALLGLVVLLAPDACRSLIMGRAPGRADTETAVADRKRMTEVSCILSDYGEIELQREVRDCQHVLMQATYLMIVVQLTF